MFKLPLILEIKEQKKKYLKQILNCGETDTIVVFEEEQDYYILSYNKNLGYAGLQYVGEEYDDNCFLDNLEDCWFEDEKYLLYHLINMFNY